MTKSKGILPARECWTTSQLSLLVQHYPHKRTSDLVSVIGRNMESIYRKANQMGIKKSEAFLTSDQAGRLDGVRGGATRFRQGQEAWNKGMKGLDLGGKETQFKPGHRGGQAARLYMPIGTERISKDGYLERKINDGMPFQKRWRAVHLLVWEAANGPLPASHAIAFKDGNKQNINVDNLECISRADLMRRNTVHNLPKELAELAQLRGALTRQINKRSADGQEHQ